MESYDVFLIGNFVALPAFIERYGIVDQATGDMVIAAKWQSALQVSGQLGALIGVFIAGPLTSRIGYRYATLTGLMLLNVFIFAFYFGDSLPVFFAAQLLEGIPWGIFIANAPAYCSEIVPIKLRAPATQMLQMFWAIGSIIVGAVTYVYNSNDGESAYRYVAESRFCRCIVLTDEQNPDRSPMDVPNTPRHPHLFGTRVAMVVGAQGTSRRSSARSRAAWTQVNSKAFGDRCYDASCH